jgi:hypothetical protein
MSAIASANPANSAAPTAPSRYWLVKLPDFVYKQLNSKPSSAPNNNGNPGPIASIQVTQYSKDNSIPPNMKLIYKPNDINMPSQFNLNVRPKKTMILFTESQQPNGNTNNIITGSNNNINNTQTQSNAPQSQINLSGEIELVSDANPVDGAEYRSLLSSRLHNSYLKTSFTKPQQESDELVANPATLNRMDQLLNKRKAPVQAEEAKKEKRVRGDREELTLKLLHLFGQKDYIAFKELQDVTNEPKQSLQDALNEVALRHTKGEHMNLYQLREKYRINK